MRHLIHGLRSILLQTFLLFALWVSFSAKGQRADLLAGAVAAMLACIASRIVARHGLGRLLPRPRWIAEAWHLPGMIVMGMGDLFKVLALQIFARRPAESRMGCVPFDATGSRDEVATRRALAVAYTTTSPNFIVVDITGHGKASQMEYHQIDPTPVPPVARHLGAAG